jgi:hypothetical protein
MKLVADCCQAFAEALAESPVVPTDAQAAELYTQWSRSSIASGGLVVYVIREWQKIMFDVPTPEYPEELEALLWTKLGIDGFDMTSQVNDAIWAAFELGRKAK